MISYLKVRKPFQKCSQRETNTKLEFWEYFVFNERIPSKSFYTGLGKKKKNSCAQEKKVHYTTDRKLLIQILDHGQI